MEMILLVGLCILTSAIINRQYASMRRMSRISVRPNERRDR